MGESLKTRRRALGIERSALADAAGLSVDFVARVERGEYGASDRVSAMAATLNRLEVEGLHDRQFPAVQTAARTRPWPTSPTRALLDFREEGAVAGADVVLIAGADRLQVLVACSPLGHRVVGAATACGVPSDGFTHFVIVAATAHEALKLALLSGQVERVLRSPVPPMRVLHRHEPGIVGVRDGRGRIALNVAEEPAAAPFQTGPEPARRTARRSPKEASRAA